MPGSPTIVHADEVTYTTGYTYDKNGNVETRTTPNGETIEYAYDSLNRLTQKTYPDLSEVTYVYDANGNRTEMTNSHGTTSMAMTGLIDSSVFRATVSIRHTMNMTRRIILPKLRIRQEKKSLMAMMMTIV